MAKDKKSFILYADIITVVEKLVERDRVDKTNNAGELFLHILEYVNDKNPITDNFIIEMAFEPIKIQLKRDLVKYISKCETNRDNGSKGGRPKGKNPKKPNGLFDNRSEAKKADNDNDNDNDILKDIYTFEQFWNDYEKKVGVKSNLEKKFNKLSLETKLKIKDYLPKYKEAQPDKQYRKNPETFLNQQSWNDELIPQKPILQEPAKRKHITIV